MAPPRDIFGLIGTTIAEKFRVERLIGEGGFGVVYAGTHVMLGEKVAIKCLKPVGFSAEEQERGAQSFMREGRILFGLGHPAIVRLYDVGIMDGPSPASPEGGPNRGQGKIPYVVLELLTGVTLDAEIRTRAGTRRHFGRDELVGVFGPILEAVAFAHERGIMHRDLKPSNMMLVNEAGRVQPKVLDFGTARAEQVGTGRAGAPEASLGKTGFTPLYAAPEQWDASYGATGPRTDVFALGLTLAEMCLLGYPMEIAPGGILSVFKASLDESARPVLARERPDLPPELERVIVRAMCPRSDERYADARELLSAFRSALKAAPSTAAMAPPLAPSPSNVPANPANLPPSGPAHSPSYGPPMTPPQGPPQPAAFYGSTTQGHAMGTYGAPPPRTSALPWLIGAFGLVIALVMVGIGAVVFFVLPAREPSAGPASPPTKVAAAPTTPPASPGSPAVPTARPAAPVATGPAPRLILGGAIGMAPFWTQSDVMDVARAHHNEMIQCAREAVAAQPRLEGPVDVTVSPNKTGVVEDVQCSMRVHNTPGETAMCGCVASVMGKWRFPPARGKLGFLDAGPFIYDYKLFPP